MSGIFDRLQSQLGSQGDEGGITPLDLAGLPPALRKIMRLMLREIEVSYSDLCEAVKTLPEADSLTPDEFDKALDDLSRQGWLIKMGQDKVSYRVNLRRKAGSTLGIWATLTSRIEESQASSSSKEKDAK